MSPGIARGMRTKSFYTAANLVRLDAARTEVDPEALSKGRGADPARMINLQDDLVDGRVDALVLGSHLGMMATTAVTPEVVKRVGFRRCAPVADESARTGSRRRPSSSGSWQGRNERRESSERPVRRSPPPASSSRPSETSRPHVTPRHGRARARARPRRRAPCALHPPQGSASGSHAQSRRHLPARLSGPLMINVAPCPQFRSSAGDHGRAEVPPVRPATI